MKRISQYKIFRVVDEESGISYIPPRYRLNDNGGMELVVRLRSTKCKENASWFAGQKAREALNKARYEPVLRAVVTQFMWEPPNTRDCRTRMIYKELPGEEWIIQTGSGVNNWYAKVVKPIPDPYLEPVTMAIANARPGGIKQGALACYRTEWSDNILLNPGSGNKWLYNHAIINHLGFISRVIDGVYYAIIKTNNETLILSPDHVGQPITLSTGTWLLRHPIPGSAD